MIQQQIQDICDEYNCGLNFIDFLQRMIDFDCDLEKMDHVKQVEFLIKIEDTLELFELKYRHLDNSGSMH